jgi:DNA-binding winged helix-turn-helix (wHTH) protein
VWENEFKEDYPLRQLVSSLKNRFPILKKYIHTIHKVGYILKKEE